MSFGRQHRADREAVAQRLRGREDVGRHAVLHVRVERAGAADARLHFIENQQRAVLVARFAQALKERGIGGQHAAFALHRLDDHRARLLADGFTRLREIVVRQVADALRLRAEAFRILRLAADAHGKERAAVERLRERDDLDLVRTELLDRVTAREFQRGFVRFGAGVREKGAIGEGQVGQAFRETQHRRVRVAVADVPELFALLVQHFQQFGMRVAERGDGDAAGEVDIVTAVGVPDARAEAAIGHEIRRSEDRDHHFVESAARYVDVGHEPLLCLVRAAAALLSILGNVAGFVLRVRDMVCGVPSVSAAPGDSTTPRRAARHFPDRDASRSSSGVPRAA